VLALDRNGGFGIAFLVSAGIVFEIIAFACSSPQTMEINAEKRAPTLMKYVHIGQGFSVVFVGAAAFLDRKRAAPILLGGITAMGLTEGLYAYSRASGLTNPGPVTEVYV
jgi:hypothetical protein